MNKAIKIIIAVIILAAIALLFNFYYQSQKGDYALKQKLDRCLSSALEYRSQRTFICFPNDKLFEYRRSHPFGQGQPLFRTNNPRNIVDYNQVKT
jgi:hypothetical protein